MDIRLDPTDKITMVNAGDKAKDNIGSLMYFIFLVSFFGIDKQQADKNNIQQFVITNIMTQNDKKKQPQE